MRNWNVQRAILPSFESPMPIIQPETTALPVNFTQPFIPSQQHQLLLQQQHHHHQQQLLLLQQQQQQNTLSSASALPAQQSMYYPPFKIPPQKGDTNEKSDFLKYLSQINQFRDIYDKNGMSYQSDLNVRGIEGSYYGELELIRYIYLKNAFLPLSPFIGMGNGRFLEIFCFIYMFRGGLFTLHLLHFIYTNI